MVSEPGCHPDTTPIQPGLVELAPAWSSWQRWFIDHIQDDLLVGWYQKIPRVESILSLYQCPPLHESHVARCVCGRSRIWPLANGFSRNFATANQHFSGLVGLAHKWKPNSSKLYLLHEIILHNLHSAEFYPIFFPWPVILNKAFVHHRLGYVVCP